MLDNIKKFFRDKLAKIFQQVDAAKLNLLSMDDLKPLPKKQVPVFFGLAQGAFIPIIGATGKGKSTLGVMLAEQYFLLGESILTEDKKYMGIPPNIQNLALILKRITSIAVIDSLSGIHPGAERYQKGGLDLAVFDLFSELDYICSSVPMVIFGIYNPYKTELESDVRAEICGRNRLIIDVDNYMAKVMVPHTRTWSSAMPFEEVWNFMIGKNTRSVGRKGFNVI